MIYPGQVVVVVKMTSTYETSENDGSQNDNSGDDISDDESVIENTITDYSGRQASVKEISEY